MLTTKEKVLLDRFVQSPFHNQHEGVIRLYQYLVGQDEVAEPDHSKEAAFAFVFPDLPYKDLKIRHVMSYLVRVIEEFLIFQEFRANDANAHLHLLRVYGRRNLPKPFHATARKIQKMQSGKAQIGPEDHHINYQVNLEQFNVTEERHQGAQDVFQRLSDELDAYYVVNKLKHACIILSHRKLFNVEYQLGLLDDVVRWVETYADREIPEVIIFYNCYKLLVEEDTIPFFEALKALIDQYGDKVESEEMRFVYTMAINYCIKRINTGQPEFLREVFEMYRKSLVGKVIYDNGKLPPWTYKNIVSAGLKLEEYDWVEKFNFEYRYEIYEEYQDSFYYYNLARLYFARSEYRRAARILNDLQVKDIFTSLDARVTLIKAWFELGEFKLIEYSLNNFSQLLHRRGILTYHKKNYKNFVRYMNKLINLKPHDGKAKAKFVDSVQSEEILTEKGWILSKVES
ncbi:MAG: hypothetical protein AAF570_07705 [Bacteroidota bacterium]